ncbi:MAG TPA: PEP/pyruvate-binding domain-containing protein [Microbacterium sp.]|nr:PEP/pyruvate-binding domain-containing protein [Microbacterium sp.]
MDAVPTVMALAELGRADVATAGGKGANLGELVRAGIRVPPGFVVTTVAYRRVAAGLTPDADGAALREELGAVALPADLAAEITAAYEALGGGAVAVRSSATAEDLPGAAFAGQQDTLLGVTGTDELLAAVRSCWVSLWNERAVAYRARLGIAASDVAIAVVVQRMVPADVAGVMFTADPVSGARDRTVLDASEGLGEAVVSGLVTPDHVVMTMTGAVESYTVGKNEVVFRSRADGSVSRDGSAENRSRGRLLSDGQLRALAAEGARIQSLFGAPQDVEWAFAGDRLSILQARPMTALPVPQRLNRVRRLIGGVLSDYFSVRPYPLDMTTWVPHGPAGMMDDFIRGLGIDAHLDATLPEQDGVVVQFVPPRPRPTWRVLGLPLRVVHRIRRYDPARWTDDPRYLAFVRERAELLALDPSTMSWRQLLRAAERTMRLVDAVTGLRSSYLPGAGRAILQLRFELTRLGARRLMSGLIAGAPTHTQAGNDELERLAALVRADPALQDALREPDAAEALRRIRSDPACAAFASALDGYLAEFGYRETDSSVLISPPTWGDRPEIVVGIVAALAVQERAREPDAAAADARRELAALPALQNPRRHDRVLRLVDAARAAIAFREDSHAAFTRLAPALRRMLMELGARLVDRGVFADPFDVFHLRFEELTAIPDIETAAPAQLAALARLVRTRAAARATMSAVPMVDYAAIFRPRAGAASDALVTGTPACAGQATGPVRVIRDFSEFGTLRAGEILVCPYTNPAWTPLFQRAAAVVVDTGGIGSHAAIVARENGIPAVMGTGDGTRVLTTGQRVRVDGTAGAVSAAWD